MRAVHSRTSPRSCGSSATELVFSYERDELERVRDKACVERLETAKSHTVRLPFLSRELLLVGVLLVLGTMVAGILSEPDSNERAARQQLGGHDGLIDSLLYSPDGRILVSCGLDEK